MNSDLRIQTLSICDFSHNVLQNKRTGGAFSVINLPFFFNTCITLSRVKLFPKPKGELIFL